MFPIGIDVDRVEQEAVEATHAEVVKRMTDSLMGRTLMIGVDRLDYSKGLVERFHAYQHFLETYPDNARPHHVHADRAAVALGRARLCRDPPGAGAGRRPHQRAFAETDWTPIRYLNRNFPHATLMGLLRAANVGIVTPLRDGMNLVAKEYVAAQNPEDPGVLILSNLAGAARELTAALQVNPYDTRAVSQAIQAALTMSLQERRERHAAMMQVLRRNDIATWTRRFVEALEQALPPENARVRVVRNH